jgi:hypothetical protein
MRRLLTLSQFAFMYLFPRRLMVSQHTYTHIIHSFIHSLTQTRTHSHRHARTHTCTHALTHARTHTHARARAHTHTHTKYYFSFEKGSETQRVTEEWGVVLVIPVPGKKVPERRLGLRPSEKERPVRSYGAFRHKNSPVLKYILHERFKVFMAVWRCLFTGVLRCTVPEDGGSKHL